ncbi:MAG: MotA/TolQ/ExbB proton channel family protein [Fibrobacteria bacterium]
MLELITTALKDFFQKGGTVMWPILATSLVVWLLCIDRVLYMRQYSRLHRKVLAAIQANNLSGLGELDNRTYMQLVRRLKNPHNLPMNQETALSRFKISVKQDLENHMNTINQYIQVAPLLGLLGTVVGMVQTFANIMMFGIGNPQLMAEGISVAMITTQAGLAVAFPAMLFLNHIQSRKNKLAATIMKDVEFLDSTPKRI